MKMKMKIHQEGREIVYSLLAILLVINGLLYFLDANSIVFILSMVASAILFFLVANFFRSPRRHYLGEIEKMVIAPADGTIVAIEEVMENEYFHDKRIQISIFMTIFNVHANWYPVNGKVVHSTHQKGRYMAAYLPKSSVDNERSTVVVKTTDGTEILMRQIAGALARRIVTYAEVGEDCDIEEHMGFIKFGSRVDLFLPLDAEILVAMDQKTTGCCTPIAKLK